MEWKDVASVVGKAAPMLGALIGGPGGIAVGALISSALGVGNTPSEVSQALLTNPDAAIKLKEIESKRQVDLQTILMQAEGNRLSADTAAIQSVNATMQSEAKSEHWAQWAWRPFNGFVFGSMFFGVYFILPLLKMPVPVVPTEAWMAIGAVLGVASWFRGKEKLAAAA